MKFIILVLILFVAGCGGGNSGEAEVPEPPPIQEVPVEPDIEEETPEPEITPVSQQCYSTDQETLIKFLEDVFYDDLSTEEVVDDDGVERPICGNGRLQRWERSPVLKVAEGTTNEEKEFTRTAVEAINEVLPDQYDIDFRENEYVESLTTEVRPGEITLDFTLPENIWCDDNPSDCPIGSARAQREMGIESAQIRIRTYETAGTVNQCEKKYQLIVTHEILHTLGFCHANHSDHQYHGGNLIKTIMTAKTRPSCIATPRNRLGREALENLDMLTKLDRDALRAMYDLLENGDYPEELRIEPEKECDSQ